MKEYSSVSDIIHEFSGPSVPIDEMQRFYEVNPSDVPLDTPYVWLMFVMSADGVASLLEKSHSDPGIGLSGPGIALKQFRDSRSEAAGAYVDWRLLQWGWTAADALIAGSGVLRAEPSLTWLPVDADLLNEYHQIHAQRPPLRVLVTGSGFTAQEMASYPVLYPDGKNFQTLVATSQKGSQKMQKERHLMSGSQPTAEFRAFGQDRVDFRELFRVLRSDYAVRTVDLQGGPDIAGQAFAHSLVHEYRITIAPAIAGGMSSDGLQRPGPVKAAFGPQDLKTMSIMKMGFYASHFFGRYKLHYYP